MFRSRCGQHLADVERALGVSVGACREDGLVSLQTVRCVGYCYAAPALLDGSVPHAAPPLAEKLARGRIIAIDDRVSAAALLRHVWRFAALESCGTCAPCRIGSVRGAPLAERIVAGDTSAPAEQQPLLPTLETASMCAFGRGVPASVRSLLRVYADEFAT